MDILNQIYQKPEGHILDLVIVLAGIILFLYFVVKKGELRKIYDKSKNKFREYSSDEELLDRENLDNSEGTYRYKVNYKQMDKVRDEYNDCSAGLYSGVQLISIFPMLGLLGTVIGIIPGLKDTGNIEIYLSTALFSTLFGLIAAIILKVYVTIWPLGIVSKIDNIFEECDRRYQKMVNEKKITEK